MVALGRHIGLPLPSGGSLIPMLFIGMGMAEAEKSHPQAWHGHPARDYYIIHGLEGRATLRLRLPRDK